MKICDFLVIYHVKTKSQNACRSNGSLHSEIADWAQTPQALCAVYEQNAPVCCEIAD